MIAMHQYARGRGVGDALMAALLNVADNSLRPRQAELACWTDKPKGLQLLERRDFVRKGLIRAFVVIDGGFCDVIMMGRMRPVPETC